MRFEAYRFVAMGRIITSVLCVLVLPGLVNAAEQVRPETPTPRQILDVAGVQGGLIVHLGVGDGRLTAALRANASYIVHALETDPVKVEQARKYIRSLGVYGEVSVEQWNAETLPYADGVVNLIVVSGVECGVSREEILRVLAPRGVAMIRKEFDSFRSADDTRSPAELPGWAKFTKPVPQEIDEWTHYMHGPNNNAVARDSLVAPPNSLQWDGPPKFLRSHEYDTGLPAMVTADGRVIYILDDGPPGIKDPRIPDKWLLEARDAFSGVFLWRRPISEWGWQQWHKERAKTKDWADLRGLRLRTPINLARRLVAVGKRVFVTLGFRAPVTVLDAATGKEIRTYQTTKGADELAVVDDRLLVLVRGIGQQERLLCLDVNTGKTVWQKSAGKSFYLISTLTVDGGRVFVCDRDSIVCYQLSDGNELWRQKRTGGIPNQRQRLHHGVSLVVADGVALVNQTQGLLALSADKGTKLWQLPGGDGYGMGFPPETYVIKGSVFYFRRPGGAASGKKKGRHKLEPWPNKNAYDLKTGKPTRTVTTPANLIAPVGHARCYHSRATERYLLLGSRAIEYLDLEGTNHVRGTWLKPACRYGPMPANGFTYVTPNQCQCLITRTLHGMNALTSRKAERQRVEEVGGRITRGPAYEMDDPPLPKPDVGSWPMFRADPRRRGYGRIRVQAELKPLWETKVGRRPVQPVAARDHLITVARDDYLVTCLRADTGEERWRFVAGGRVDSSPTIYRSRVLFGCADGYVYSLRLKTGELAWRFRAAPAERRIVSYDRVESAWPVHGSILVMATPEQKNIAYFAAGRSCYLDGGIWVYGLDPMSGEVLHKTVLDAPVYDVHKGGYGKNAKPGVLRDVLVTDGHYVFLRNVTLDHTLKRMSAADLAAAEIRPKAHLSAWAGITDDNWWDRTFWFYGKDWPIRYAYQSPKAGQIISVDDTTTYAVKGFHNRNLHSFFFFPGKKGYLLYADRNDVQPSLYDGGPDKKPVKWMPTVTGIGGYPFDAVATKSGDPRGPGYSRTRPALWAKWLPVRMRAMVATKEMLFVAGPPDICPREDPLAPLEGRAGAKLRAIDPKTGETVKEYDLKSPPVFDGMMAAYNRLYIAAEDGRLLCMGAATP